MAVNAFPDEQNLPTNWWEHTQLIAKTLYEDKEIGAIKLDLHSACSIGKYDCVQEAVNQNEDLNKRNKGGWTPLMYAAYVGHDTVLNLLLEADADPNQGTADGLSPLMVAAGCGNESVCFFLIHSGALIDQQDNAGCTALYYASRQGHQSTVQLLLKEGANIEICEYQFGYTPLMIAAIEGDQIVLDVLIACQADITAISKDGHTARSLALKHNHIKTVSFLDEIQMLYYPRSLSAASNESDVASSIDEDQNVVNDCQTDNDKDVRQSISMTLGKRSGPRVSLPISTTHRASLATTERRLHFRPSKSMPEQIDVDDYDDLLNISSQSHDENMRKLSEFLQHLELFHYYDVFEKHEIDFSALMQLSDEELKKLVDKMGPRRKLQIAIKQMKEQYEVEESGDMGRSMDVTPTPEYNSDKVLKIELSQLKSAYQQALQSRESCEQRLLKEYELRKMAERYCHELQKCRTQSLESTQALKETLTAIKKHCHSIGVTRSKLSALLKQQLGSDSSEIHMYFREFTGEIEAVLRSSQQADKEFNAVQYHLSASFHF